MSVCGKQRVGEFCTERTVREKTEVGWGTFWRIQAVELGLTNCPYGVTWNIQWLLECY